MSQQIKASELPEFDITEYLDSDEAIAEYLSIVLEENDPAALLQALGTVARARGMTDIARASGISREGLYKTLRPGAMPRFDTVWRVINALGFKLHAEPTEHIEKGNHAA